MMESVISRAVISHTVKTNVTISTALAQLDSA